MAYSFINMVTMFVHTICFLYKVTTFSDVCFFKDGTLFILYIELKIPKETVKKLQ